MDAEDKSRLVAKEYNTGDTDEFFAQATTMPKCRLVDALAYQRRHSRMTLDVRRAVLHLIEGQTVLVELPDELKEAERAAGRSGAALAHEEDSVRAAGGTQGVVAVLRGLVEVVWPCQESQCTVSLGVERPGLD